MLIDRKLKDVGCDCYTKNTIPYTVHVCCDSRKNDCGYYFELDKGRFLIGVCLKRTRNEGCGDVSGDN